MTALRLFFTHTLDRPNLSGKLYSALGIELLAAFTGDRLASRLGV